MTADSATEARRRLIALGVIAPDPVRAEARPPLPHTGRRFGGEPSPEVVDYVARAIASADWFTVESLGDEHGLGRTGRRHLSKVVARACAKGLLDVRHTPGVRAAEFRAAS